MKLLLLLALALAAGAQSRKTVTDAEVARVHRSALLIDTHNDVTTDTLKGIDISKARLTGHTDLVRLRKGGVGAVFFAAYVSGTYEKTNQSAHRALEMIDTIRHDIVKAHPQDFELATTAADIERIHASGKIAALIGLEGGHAIEDSPRLLRQFYALGVRYMTLTHANTNLWAGSSGDALGKEKGLSKLGREFVAEMNRLGMMVDISHVSDKTFFDVLAVSKAPPMASHSSCRALSAIARNMSDDMISALAKKGGVVQINFGCEFISQNSANHSPWLKTAPKGVKVPPAKLDEVVAHIDHAVKVAGIDHVGIGTDFDGVECVPVGLEDVSKFPALTRALLERGYTGEQVRKIYGGNLLRVMRAAEAAAQR
ncbi:MAG: dipeptidase [Acidobacteriota bacterium]